METRGREYFFDSEDAQKGRPARPQAYPQGYVEDFDELRTKLADFSSSN